MNRYVVGADILGARTKQTAVHRLASWVGDEVPYEVLGAVAEAIGMFDIATSS